MMTLEWRHAFASVAGTSHEKLGLPCQDASDCRVLEASNGDQHLVAVVSDGAGSAKRAEVGAQLACSLLIDEIVTLFECGGAVQEITRPFMQSWLDRFQSEVLVRAEAEGLRPRDFACTLVAAVVGTDSAVFVQIGDGAIVVSCRDEPDDYAWIFWPRKGEYENQTIFATDAVAREELAHELVDQRIHEVALFTDGLQRLALHFQSQAAHAPFFRPLFASVRAISDSSWEPLSASLVDFLDSPRVRDRTDDDKSLILASRRLPADPASPVADTDVIL
jgi:hypothetical protein